MRLFGTTACESPKEEIRFFTEGNCEACQEPIEEALRAISGVETANWDYASSFSTVIFNPNKTSEEALQQALAEAGFATRYFPPDAEAQAQLPACCQEPISRKLTPSQPLPAGH